MEEPENSKPWFITHEGERSGPYSMEDLKEKVALHEIHPRYDMAWKEGMEDWIPAGEVKGLFEKKGGSEEEEKADQDQKKKKKKKKEEKAEDTTSPFGEDEFGEEPSNNVEEEEWEGVSRGGYFFFIYVFPILWMVGLSYAAKMLPGILGEDIAPIAVTCLAFLPMILGIVAVIQRLDNLAMRRIWLLGLLVPFLNLWLGYRLFACPPGYAEHKRLGALGWILGIFYWLPLAAILALGALIAVKGPEILQPILEKNGPQIEEWINKANQITETPEEKKEREAEELAKEKAAKGPSIIPIR